MTSTTHNTSDLTVIVVNWNTADLLDDCLQSVVDHAPAGHRTEVIVVDNASTDGSREHLATAWPTVRVIANDENVGFCRANNQAIRETDAPYLLLLNTDARLTPGCTDAMLRHFEEDPGCAVVGPRLVYGDGSFQRWTAGRSLSVTSCANYFLGLDRLARCFPRFGGMYLSHDTATSFEPGWVTSAVMLLRRRALDEFGLLDESIFVYMDDVDLCQRATDAGWRIWYEADATAVHLMGASSIRSSGSASPEAIRALNRWFHRRHGSRSATALRLLEAAGFGGRAVFNAGRWLVNRDAVSEHACKTQWARAQWSLERADG